MRKIYLFLLALICSVGAWAQTVVTTPQVSTATTQYRYTLHCKATDHNSYLGIKDDAFNGRLAEEYATQFEFENGPADGQYYLKSVELGYVTANGGNITFEATPSTYWTFTLGEGWTYLLANGQNGVYLNNNKTTGDGIKTAAGTGDCSHWVLTEYVTEAQPLSWSEVKDGYTYAIVNVQPATVDYKKYYLNNSDGTLTPIDATNFNSLSKWPETAQFVAKKQTDGKFAFKNVANGQYLAWRAHATANPKGENNNKGLVDAVDKWSSWTMNESTREGFVGTYYPTCANRNSTTVRTSTLLIANNGSWNAWAESECTNTGYSNNYGFVELAAPTMPIVEFNYILSFEGQTKIIPVSGRVGSTMPTVTIPALFTATMPIGTIAANQEDVTINLTLKNGIMPFQYFEQSSAISQWYTLKMRDNYWMKYSATGDVRFPLSTTSPSVNDNARLFAFVGNPLTGFKIVSYAEGKYQYVTATTGNNSTCGATANVADATTLFFEVNSGHTVFKVDGNAYLNAIASSTKLGVWNATAASTDGGSTFTFAEADVAIFNLDTYKAEVIASLPNVPALFSSDDLATATNAINDVACGNDEASINAAKAEIATAVSNLYATAAGKKFTYKSSMYNTVRYLAAPNAKGALTTTEDVDRYNVFVLEHVSGANFKVKAPAVNAYLNSTNTAENGSTYNFIYQGQENYISLQFDGTGEAIHHQQTGNLPVRWSTSSDASKWTIESVSDEQWAEMTALPDITALQTLIDNTKAGYYDDWNGVWRIGDGLNSYNYITEPAKGMELQTYLTTAQDFIDNLTSDNTDEEVTQIIGNINSIIENLTINQPADGSFLRIRSVKSGMGYVNAEVSSAHGGCLAVGGKGDNSIYYYKGGKLISYTKAQYLVKNSDGKGFLALGETGAEGTSIEFGQATQQAGCYTVIYSGDRYLYAADNATNTDAGGSEGNNGYDFWLEEVTTLPVTLSTIGGHNYGTFYTPVGISDLDGVKAYIAKKDGDKAVMTAIEAIPANTAVVLYAKDADKTSATFAIGEADANTTGNILTGQVATIATVSGACTLQNGSNGLGFYSYNGTALKGFKAYLNASEHSVKSFTLDFDMETAIRGIQEAEEKSAAMYDMSGRRILKAQKGVYLQNGKKYVK